MPALSFDKFAAAAAAVVMVVIMSVNMSDSASVPISSSSSTTVPASSTTPINNVSNDDVDLALLASSKILMDRTSSSSSFSTSTSKESTKVPTSTFRTFQKDDEEDVRLARNANLVHEKDVASSSTPSSGNDSTLSKEEENKVSAEKPQQQERQFVYSSVDGGVGVKKNERNSYEMSSPLHVARCRATCLQKFHTEAQQPIKVTADSTDHEEYLSSEEMHLLPLLRLRKRRSFSEKKSTWSCQEDSFDCATCWKSCELFEPRDNKNKEDTGSSHSSSGLFPREEPNEPTLDSSTNDQMEKDGESKQSKLSFCSTIDPKQCIGGCMVACSFYENFSVHTGESSENRGEQDRRSFKGNPVIATKHESVVQIVPGKITWPVSSTNTGKELHIPVVYVVIQEYPDRKWRQIAQTTETFIDIPTELTSTMSAKLRSVRILAVGPEGLLSVYSPETPVKQLQNKDGKGVKATTSTASLAASEAKNNDVEMAVKTTQEELNGSSSSANFNEHLNTDPVDSTIASSSFTTPKESSTHDQSITGDSRHVPSIYNDLHVEGPFLFELRVASLIHQKSLVICELKWDEIGGNPRQEYLITWELTAGGLKGHLITDSTSVTLSLWPDTTYQIQVEQFLLNLDSDGEQPAPSSTSIKSLPLIVDTSEAAFPMEKPSALLSLSGSSNEDDEEEDEDDYENEDVSFHEGNETVKEEETHKSFTGGFLNMTLLLAIAISALIFVLVILTVAAFTWTKMRKLSSENDNSSSPMITPTKNSSGYYSPSQMKRGYSSSSYAMEPEPLLSQEDLCWEEYCHVPSPVYYATTIPSSDFSHYSPYEKRGPTVSVISSAESNLSREPPCSYLSYFRGVENSSHAGSSNLAYSLLSDPASATASGKLGCPSTR